MDTLLNYRLPAEWEKHESTWLSFPVNQETWPFQMQEAQEAYLKFIQAISLGEKVNLILPEVEKEHVLESLDKLNTKVENIICHHWKTNDAWIRDYGPDFLVNPSTQQKLLLNWQYNAWGGKYPPFEDDNLIPDQIRSVLGYDIVEIEMILEGGSFDVNGVGDLLTTKACLLHPNRNPDLSQEEIESALRKFLQIENIIWLDEGIVGDDTDGHVDDITRFVNEDTIITVVENNTLDENYQPLQDNLQLLSQVRLLNGKQPTLVELPMPQPFYYQDLRLPASYANFYICNAGVIVPVFNDPNDDEAVRILESVFPDKKVIPIYSGDIVYGLGSFHCLSKQEAAIG